MTMSYDKSSLVTNIVTENENGDSSVEKKARNRMVAEGYKYHVLDDRGEHGILGMLLIHLFNFIYK